MGAKNNFHLITLVLMLLSQTISEAAINPDCPHLRLCLISRRRDCGGWPGGRPQCIAQLKDVCHLKEDKITFKQISDLSEQFCQKMQEASVGGKGCKASHDCMMESDITKRTVDVHTNLNSEAPPLTWLNSQTWCQFLQNTTRCFLTDSCSWGSTITDFMTRQQKYLSTACPSASISSDNKGSAVTLITTMTSLWTVVITAGIPFFCYYY